MCLEYTLVELQHKIDKIEDEDENYRENKKWKKYRKLQDYIYNEIRERNEQDERNFWKNCISGNARLSKRLERLHKTVCIWIQW